ncbi:hypothetical protein PIB30_069314 [Stylosanthes scabra]|uniref:Uncharacterized protein n=1 Tax=Stylosanthes scabra TaxID=79078 RepID=A0ABU6WLJ6_9FABA|nr:hypothetical protein [Stylosanthes scabra]
MDSQRSRSRGHPGARQARRGEWWYATMENWADQELPEKEAEKVVMTRKLPEEDAEKVKLRKLAEEDAEKVKLRKKVMWLKSKVKRYEWRLKIVAFIGIIGWLWLFSILLQQS